MWESAKDDRRRVSTAPLWNSKPTMLVECFNTCLLYTSDAADDLLCVDLGGRRIIKKNNNNSSQDVRMMLQIN